MDFVVERTSHQSGDRMCGLCENALLRGLVKLRELSPVHVGWVDMGVQPNHFEPTSLYSPIGLYSVIVLGVVIMFLQTVLS